MERLTPLSAAFLDAEDDDPRASLAIGSLAVFEGPAPPFDDFVAWIESRLPLIPRYRRRLRTVPLDIAAPAWVDDADFDLRWHVRNTALPAPGGSAEIARLMSRVMSQRMDRRRPLWEYWFVEGLADGRWALLSKVHHSMVDGVSGTDLYRLLFTTERAAPGRAVAVTPVPGIPEPLPGPSFFVARAVGDLLATPLRATRVTARLLASPRRLATRATQTALGLAAMSGALRPLEDTSLTGALDGSRRYSSTTVSLDDVSAVRRAFGGTVNDVALAAVTGAFRELLLARGEEPGPHSLRSLVPVSTREAGEESVLDNRVSLLLPYLPVDVTDPRERLAEVQHRVRMLAAAGEPAAGAVLTAAAEHAFYPLVALGTRLGLRLPQHQVATVTTNVPGPRTTLYGLGREVQELLPYVPIADRVRIGVAMLSYRSALTFGVTADYRAVPDVDVLTAGISRALAELVDAASLVTPERAATGPAPVTVPGRAGGR
jgi:diacylglycerol O-acyltransferase